jgi:hypothetical protein
LIRTLLIAASAFVLAAAAPEPTVETSPLESEIERISELADRGKVKEALAQLDQAERKFADVESRARIGLMRGFIRWFGSEGKDKAGAIAAFDAAEALEGSPAIPLTLLKMGREGGGLDLAVHGLTRLATSYPDVARDLDRIEVGSVLAALWQFNRRDEQRALKARLGRIGFGGDWIATRDNYAVAAIDDHLSRGETAEAREIATTINDRSTLTTLLTDRSYETLWPGLEARIGDRMEQSATAAVLTGERLFKAHPNDVQARAALLGALIDAGRDAEADKLAAQFATTPEQVKALDEHGGWLINDHAKLLRRLDRKPEADARMAQLASLDIAEKPWLISMRINRFIGLIKANTLDEAAPLLTEAGPWAERHGSPYARQLVRTYALCHAVMQNRSVEAEAMLPAVLAHEKDGPGASAEALMCLGRRDEAATRVAAQLNDPDHRDVMISHLQPGASTESDWLGDLAPLREHPEVRAVFDKAARVLPARFRHKE